MARIPRVPIGSSTLPLLGFGTAVFPFVASETMKESILHAIKLGYRHIDAASLYNSEQALGEAITEALGLGLIQSREELFITSKLWCGDAHPHLVLPALRKTLKNLGLAYLDLYLVHFPVSLKPGSYVVPFDKMELLPMDFKSVWEAMEVCHGLGLAKSIGVSNFSCKKLQGLLATARIPPAVNQHSLVAHSVDFTYQRPGTDLYDILPWKKQTSRIQWYGLPWVKSVSLELFELIGWAHRFSDRIKLQLTD